MRKRSINAWPLAIAFLCTFAISLPLLTAAESSRTSPDNIQERFDARSGALLEELCARITASADRGLPISLPAFCIPTPPPPPVDVCPNVPGNQATGPCADTQCVENGGAWNGDSCDMPPPPPIDECPNVPGTQESGPCADAECVEDGGTWNGASCDMPPEEIIGHVVISEVHYDVDAAHGVNVGNDNNEWVELYNGSAETVDLSGWKLADNSPSGDTLPEDTFLPAGAFLIVTATSSTASFWPDLPGDVAVIVLGGQIGNGLAAGGDVVFLRNAEDTTVDAVSWGTNTDAFTPSVAVAPKGHSTARTSLATDTDSAVDWEEREIPSPGLVAVPFPN